MSLSDNERIALEGPAVAANFFTVRVEEFGIRLSFCERVDPDCDLRFRCAVLLNRGDARALQDLLEKMLAAMDAAEAAAGARDD